MTSVVRYLCALPLLIALLCAGAAWADPPGRVGRLSVLDGEVSLRPADSRQWEDATRNWPLTSGDALDTGRRARAEVRIGSSVVRLDGSTTIDVRQLDDERIRILLERGSVALRVRSTDAKSAIEIETPEGLVVAGEPGQYRVDYEDGRTTLTNYRGGELEFRAVDSDVVVTEGRRAQIVFTDRTEVRWDEADRDDFADWSLARDTRDDRIGRPRHVSPEMTGAEDLYEYGDWRDSDDYGTVWYPRDVPDGWAPYRSGRWVSIEPWGWTWIDEAPWGFAPFHYGRWVLVRGAWAWVPGAYVARPIYAPALVVWMGTPGVSISMTSGHLPHVGWFPLAPREVYVPAYRHSPTYVRQINITHVTNVVNITRIVEEPRRARYTYRDHRDAVTVVPGDVLRLSRPVHRDALRDVGRNWRERHTVTPVPPIDARLVAERQRRERAAQPRDGDRRREERIRQSDGVRAVVEERRRRERDGAIRQPVQQLREAPAGEAVRRGAVPPVREVERDRGPERRTGERDGIPRADAPPARDAERRPVAEPPQRLRVAPQEQEAARERERQEGRQRMLDAQQQERGMRERQQQDESQRQQRERADERAQAIRAQEQQRQEQLQRRQQEQQERLQQQEQVQRQQQRDRERQLQLQQRQQQIEQGQERERQQQLQQRERQQERMQQLQQQERAQQIQQQQERARMQQLQQQQQERARAQQFEQQQQERARAEAERRARAQQEMRQAPVERAAPRGQPADESAQGRARRFNDSGRPDN